MKQTADKVIFLLEYKYNIYFLFRQYITFLFHMVNTNFLFVRKIKSLGLYSHI